MESQVNRDIIIIGQQPWDTEIGSNCKNIALEFSKTHRVIYVNSPLDRITLYRKKNDPGTQKRLNVIQKKETGLVKIQDNLWNYYPDCMVESINWIGNTFLFDLANQYNNAKFAKSVKKAIDILGFSQFILFNDNEMFKGFYLKKYLKPSLSIYYSRDYMVAVDYWKKHGETLEPKLIADSDICVANSNFLAAYCRKFNPNSFYVGQGCDLDIFVEDKSKAVPADLALVKRPLIGYVGALQSIRLDKDIIAHIAISRPDWSVVLVGPEDDLFKASDLHQFKNVIFTGIKAISDLPDYINAFDVCINPQLVNEVTIGNYPRKIDEYLAIGKPVVATATTAMETFSDFVYLAQTKEDYVLLIEKALNENSLKQQGQRREFALEHTWENSVAEIYKAIELVEH
ncbi:glycosyltransferase [Pedobacter sp. L105]|uniref:glycosyltransferase n=1 Tax=Pedobacter sp. L105 TaxID=1641871 RepID=UPI00131D28BD|nr:glycosyltransferase [Pedobacter sp. L105]